eukprot:364321-Chlamydomonas_euryale.AAC.11
MSARIHVGIGKACVDRYQVSIDVGRHVSSPGQHRDKNVYFFTTGVALRAPTSIGRLSRTPQVTCRYMVAMPPRAATAATAAGSEGNAFLNNVNDKLVQRRPRVAYEPAALLAKLAPAGKQHPPCGITTTNLRQDCART